jgi:NAD(P)-dependent dehydrogenase (short-subunit alcohol dehydrogenase family)
LRRKLFLGPLGKICQALISSNRGLIETPMQQKSVETRGGEMNWKCQIMRKGAPQEVAALIAWLLCDDTQYISGTVQHIDGGWVC